MQRTVEKRISACVFAFISVFLFMPAVGIGAGAHDAFQLEHQQSSSVCQQLVAHATRAVTLGTERLGLDAARLTSEAVHAFHQAVERLQSSSHHVHTRHAAKHLRASKAHLEMALQHWETGDLKQAHEGAMLVRDYAEASMVHAQCRNFLCR